MASQLILRIAGAQDEIFKARVVVSSMQTPQVNHGRNPVQPKKLRIALIQIFKKICLRSMSQMGIRHNATKASENRSEAKLGVPRGAKKCPKM